MSYPGFPYLIARVDGPQLPTPIARVLSPMIVLSSLALGGAERIVLDWAKSLLSEGHTPHLVVLHTLEREMAVPAMAKLTRASGNLRGLLESLAADLARKSSPVVYTHLIRDEHLEVFWNRGVKTVPAVHNARAGWRNDVCLWSRDRVPFVLAVSDRIADEVRAANPALTTATIRHKPTVHDSAFTAESRRLVRAKFRVADDELLVGCIGSVKFQKDYPKALQVLHELRKTRKAKLVILGGAQGPEGQAELLRVMREGARLNLAGHVFLPGFVQPVDPYLAGFDIVLNTSSFEGLSIATQEALEAGVPVVASDVGGQREIRNAALTLLPADAAASSYAAALAVCSVRTPQPALDRLSPFPSARLWTLAAAAPLELRVARKSLVLFVTANLNAGGAQRSLVNLACGISRTIPVSVCVTGTSTHPYFSEQLVSAGIEVRRADTSRNVFDIAEEIFRQLSEQAVSTICFWNADPKLKLLLTKFSAHLPLKFVDVSPGHYAFLEMDEIERFQEHLAFTSDQYYARLSKLVLKYDEDGARLPPALEGKTVVIRNGVYLPEILPRASVPRVVVQGRIAPSKQLDTICEAMPFVWALRPDVELHIFGQAELRHSSTLSSLFEQVGEDFGRRIVFHGARPDLGAELSTFDVAVVLGEHQGCPNTVLEAIAAEVPVVANDSGGTREQITHGDTGWLLPEKTGASDIAQMILLVLGQPAIARAAALKAKTHIGRLFSMPQMCANYTNLFLTL